MHKTQSRELLAEALGSMGAAPHADAPQAADRLLTFSRRVLDANQRFNLTACSSLEEFLSRHVLDCAAGFALLRRRGLACGAALDAGSGAGLPGVVWAILGGLDRVLCCESTGKKAEFIRATARELRLASLEVESRRAEDLARDPAFRDRFDVAAARALAPLPVLIELTAPFVRPGGHSLYFKGRAVEDELRCAARAMAELGMALTGREPYSIPGHEGRGELLLFQKTAPTPERYPRRAGIPGKRPL